MEVHDFAGGGFPHAHIVHLAAGECAALTDLARGADVTLIDENTVAVVPHGAKDAKKYVRLLLTFGKDRLSERRLVEMPGDKVLYRETCSEKGVIKVLDGDGKDQVRHAG